MIIVDGSQAASGSLGTVDLPTNGITGLSISGITDSGAQLNFFGAGEALIGPAGGQARVEAVDLAFTTLSIQYQLGNLFDRIVFKLDAAPGSNITVTAFNQSLVQTIVILALPSDGFINVKASGADHISKVTLSAAVNIASIGQVRVDELAGPQGTVPEPATFSIVGMGLLGLAVARRKRA